MKKSFIRCTGLLVLAGMLGTGCTKRFSEINTNPASYNQQSFDPNYLLTSAELAYTGSTDFAYETWRANLIYASTFMQGLSSVISYWGGDKYLLNPGYTASYWGFPNDAAYPEQIKPITDVVQSTADKAQYKNLHQIARILRALMLERVTDLYGDCPYFQAGMGVYGKAYFPVYDAQSAIYAELLKEVEAATNALDPAADKPAGDVIYKGDVTKWKKFGNTLMLRIGMRLVKVDAATAQATVQKVVGKTFTSNDDNAFVLGDATGGRTTQNRNSQVLLGDGGQENFYTRWSNTFIDMLKTAGDPRLGKVAVTNLYVNDGAKTQNPSFNANPATQKGMPNGKDLSGIPAQDIKFAPGYTTFTDYSSPHPGMIKRDGPTFILTYAESELLLADAGARFGIAGNIAQHYHDGVKAAITYLSQYDAAMAVSDADAETFVTAHPYVPASGLQQINTQYWLHTVTMLDFYECWCNWRRSGFPALVPVVYPNNATNGTIPRRFPYPLDEANNNPVNYKKAHDAVPGGDLLTGRVWWDK
ncbi:MAG TPA: SusD/RagB family nutrient-binding outer membrane lipoprotein [Puia sp.]